MELIKRRRDVITGTTRLTPLHSLPDFPVFMGCVDHPRSEDLVADMSWDISEDSGVVQLRGLIPLDVLYQAQHAAGVGELWMEHHRAFADFLGKVNPTAVLELGAAHGLLAREYQRRSRIPWTILEPNPAPVEGCEARFIKGFFDEDFRYDDPFDVVVHSHVLEHSYEPDRFIAQLAALIPSGKHLVFALPNLEEWLKRYYTTTLNFEHTVLLSEPYVEYLLAKHGFKVVTKEYFRGHHSIFWAAVRDPGTPAKRLPDGLEEKNRRLYLDFVDYHKGLIKDLNARIAGVTQPLYLFGAHIFSQYLIAFGLDTSKIVSLLDNDGNKQGHRLYGTDLMVRAPSSLAADASPVVILKTGLYNDEIKADILGNINASTRFLE